MNEFLNIANSMADEAGNIVRQYFRQPFEVETKADNSPVTIADREIEKAMREILEDTRPQDGIIGEEFSDKHSQSGLTWVLDPIDGTKSFVIGRPTFGTLIALCEGGAPVLGLIDQPILNERWIGAEGQTTFNGKAVKTSACTSLEQARCASTTPDMFKDTGPVYQAFEDSCTMMAWGGDCYMYGLIANGYLDIIIEASLQIYDYMAHVPIIQNAGGRISDFAGNELTLESGGTVLACGDPALMDQALELIAKS